MVVHGGDVGELGVPDPLGQGVPPGRAVAGRAAVVDLHDRETGVQPGGPAGVEGVLVAGGRAAVHGEHRRPAARSPGVAPGRDGQQRVDPAAGPVHPDVAHRFRPRRRLAGRPQQHAVGAVRSQHPQLAGGRGARPAVPDGAVRPRRRAGHHPGGHRQRRSARRRRGRSGAPWCGRRGCARTSSAVPSGIEVGIQVAGQVDRQFGDRAGGRIPDQQLVAAPPFVPDQHPLVARRPARRSSRQGLCRARRTARR